jgi:hypothetical protein
MKPVDSHWPVSENLNSRFIAQRRPFQGKGAIMIDVFKKLDGAHVETNPFPYLVIEDILPEDICDALIREMPPLHVLTHGQPPGDNQRFNFSYADANGNPDIPQIWREVLAQAVSQNFLDRILRLFAPSIREFYPDFERRFAPIHELKAQLRRKDQSAWKSRWPGNRSRQRSAIKLDAQIAVNTPALTGGTSVRTPHLDRTDKIFIGLLYLRLPEDNSKGADLELLSPKKEGRLVYGRQRLLPVEQTKHVRTIPYRRNTLAFFLNTPRSLHGVSPRATTPYTRYFINLIGETSEPLFNVDVLPPAGRVPDSNNRWRGLLNRILSGGVDRDARV